MQTFIFSCFLICLLLRYNRHLVLFYYKCLYKCFTFRPCSRYGKYGLPLPPPGTKKDELSINEYNTIITVIQPNIFNLYLKLSLHSRLFYVCQTIFTLYSTYLQPTPENVIPLKTLCCRCPCGKTSVFPLLRALLNMGLKIPHRLEG